MDKTGKNKLKRLVYKKRKINFLFFTAVKLFLKRIRKSNTVVKSVFFYPAITDEVELSDVFNRISWGLPSESLTIYVTVSDELLNIDVKNLIPPAIQRSYIGKKKLNIQLVPASSATSHFKSDSIFILTFKFLWKWNIITRLHKVEIVDTHFFSTVEPNVWRGFYIQTKNQIEREELRSLSLENYKKLENTITGDKAYCFTSGPSFDKYQEFKYPSDSFKVICNSIVKNRVFLDYIVKPDLLVFADPVFHFSPCEYSALFRDQARSVILDYDCFFMVPEYTLPLLVDHYPEIAHKAIGMPTLKEKRIHFPTEESFWVKSSDNILTLLMLPIASSLNKEIYIIGSDGRKKEEKYFWKHSSAVQYDDLMQTVFDTHPSFFRDRDYADYFDQHCKYLNAVIEFGEQQGKKYYSLTPSYIPALSKRLFK